MSKHEKFELEDLPKSAVVNSTFYNEESEVDKLINEVVTEHLIKIVEDNSTNNDLESKKSIDESSESINMHPESGKKLDTFVVNNLKSCRPSWIHVADFGLHEGFADEIL